MAAYFQLISKVTNEPESFNKIDDFICNHFNQPIDEHKYYNSWYDFIGLHLACGKSFSEIIESFSLELQEPKEKQSQFILNLLNIAKLLDKHYISNHWSGR